jgi:hypothetical protein
MKATQKIVLLTALLAAIGGGAIAGCTSTITTTPLPTGSTSSDGSVSSGATGSSDGSPPPPVASDPGPQTFNRGAIEFQAGATSALIRRYLPATDDIDRYTLQASAGQPANISISSPGQKVLLTIIDPNGNPIVRYQGNISRWSGTLPADGTYIIEAVADGGASSYDLRINIEPTAASNPQTYDQGAIQFQPGAVAATVRGNLATTNDSDRYTFVGTAGQPTRITVDSPDQKVVLAVVAPDGEPLLRSVVGSPVWSGTLPLSGTYLVYADAIEGPSPYTLNLDISPQNE